MPLAASSSSSPASSRDTSHIYRLFAAWQILPAAFAGLIAFLALVPDGIAEPVQAFACWMLVGLVALFAVGAIAKGLERLLDCEAG